MTRRQAATALHRSLPAPLLLLAADAQAGRALPGLRAGTAVVKRPATGMLQGIFTLRRVSALHVGALRRMLR